MTGYRADGFIQLEGRCRMGGSAGRRVAIILLLMLVILQACARSVPEVNHVALNARFTLLIASDASEFKDAVRARVFDHYKSYSNVEVINIGKLKARQANDFDAVLIIDTCLGWSRFNPSMKAFLDKAQNPERVVLFMTVDDTEWDFSYQSVDAITAASHMEDDARVAADLIRKLDNILQARSSSAN
jgi:hypothetical protein